MEVPFKRQARRLVALTGLLLTFAAVPASAQASIQLGAYTPGAPANAQALADYTSMVGRQPDIVMWYRDFGLPLLYSNESANLRATGQIPMITWEPEDESMASIAAGKYDAYLHESAKVAKTWGSNLMIRFAHEMNGDWYTWGTDNTSSTDFVAAWRHVVDVFRADGVANVQWVWSPNVQEGSKYAMAPLFPGDDYVDYIGLDGYNWGTADGETWQSAESVFAYSYGLVTQMSSKPVMITETSSSETGGDKAAWIRDTFLNEVPKLFPRVAAVIWFNKSQEDDWRINSSQASLDAYRAVAACSTYGGAQSCEAAPQEPPKGKGNGKGKGKKRTIAIRGVHVPERVSSHVSGTLSYGVTDTAEVQIRVKRPGHKTTVIRRKSSRGHHRLGLARILHRRHVRVGRYRVVVIARNDEGHRTRPHKAHFRVV
jgi:Glycosyl hydrolase family 26